MKGRTLDHVVAAARDHRSVALATDLTTGRQLLLDGEQAEGDLALEGAASARVAGPGVAAATGTSRPPVGGKAGGDRRLEGAASTRCARLGVAAATEPSRRPLARCSSRC